MENYEGYDNNSLQHFGILGMKWGVRRYQNKDGSLTPQGRSHWGIGQAISGIKKSRAKAQRAKYEKSVARGEKLASKGRTIGKEALKSLAVYGTAVAASYGMNKFLNSRAKSLRSQGRWTLGHQKVAGMIDTGFTAAVMLGSAAYSARKTRNINDISRYEGRKARQAANARRKSKRS